MEPNDIQIANALVLEIFEQQARENEKPENQCKRLMRWFDQGKSASAETSARHLGISGSCFHRRLTDLRVKYNYPVDKGTFVRHISRYKVYQKEQS